MLVKTYGDHALSETTCRDWFRRFKNNDFDFEDKERSGAPKKFEDEELKTFLHEDSCQMLAELAESLGVDHTTISKHLKLLRMIQNQGY
ncbi:Mariner Mos1 transposase [Acromyrmex echinatior]|uniref:Mariner Mos1 transposase n=1 Tax=Acromyrmex echinatior TaxID=103372 RepID=F4WQY1_ACREC|nr:Mariner Mos1 transposase [Acromyrmex echinatior]